MSKSILIIDTPEKCDGCILHGTMAGKQICNAEIKRVKDESKKPDWCPLKEMPQKKESASFIKNGVLGLNQISERMFVDGYNACIDGLLKERGED